MSDFFDALDAAQIQRHRELLARYRDEPAEAVCADIVLLAQIAAFKSRQQRVLNEARAMHREGATHECDEWMDRAGRCQVCDAQVLPDCECRNPVCGHTATQHTGEGGACCVPGCRCGPRGWT